MGDEFDLFGDPVRLPDGRRGRPAHRPTQKFRNKVMMLQAVGWSNERIANALHISLPTLRKHYFSELKRRSIQRDRLHAWRLEMAMKLAQTGNVGALKLLDQQIRQQDQLYEAARLRNGEEKAPEPLGKKEMQRREAKGITSDGDVDGWGADLKPGMH